MAFRHRKHGRARDGNVAHIDDRDSARRQKLVIESAPDGKLTIARRLVHHPDLMVVTEPDSAVSEMYRRLANEIERPDRATGRAAHVVAVTSAVPNEGKTTTVVNLALALAEDTSRNVLLIDADLRQPSVGDFLDFKPGVGFIEVLTGEVKLSEALVKVAETGLTVLTAGGPSRKPAELLRGGNVPKILGQLREMYGTILIDTPPCVPFADVGILEPHCDGVVMVTRAGRSSPTLIDRAVDGLGDSRLLGVVLNGVRVTPVDRYYHRYDRYGYYGEHEREAELPAKNESSRRR